MFRNAATRLAHSSNPVSGLAGNKDLRPLQELIAAEKLVLLSIQKLSTDIAKAAEALKAWASGEGDDLGDILGASGSLQILFSNALSQFAFHCTTIRDLLKSIRTREESLNELKGRQKSTLSKLDSAEKKLNKMTRLNKGYQGQVASVNELRDESKRLDGQITIEEAQLGDMKRSISKTWMGLKFAGLVECSEKGAVIGEYGKLISATIPEETTQPGMPRPAYYGRPKVHSLLNDAHRSVKEVRAASVAPSSPSDRINFVHTPILSQPGLPVAAPGTPITLNPGQLLPGATQNFARRSIAINNAELAQNRFSMTLNAPNQGLGLGFGQVMPVDEFGLPLPTQYTGSTTSSPVDQLNSAGSLRSPTLSTFGPRPQSMLNFGPGGTVNTQTTGLGAQPNSAASDDLLSPFLPALDQADSVLKENTHARPPGPAAGYFDPHSPPADVVGTGNTPTQTSSPTKEKVTLTPPPAVEDMGFPVPTADVKHEVVKGDVAAAELEGTAPTKDKTIVQETPPVGKEPPTPSDPKIKENIKNSVPTAGNSGNELSTEEEPSDPQNKGKIESCNNVTKLHPEGVTPDPKPKGHIEKSGVTAGNGADKPSSATTADDSDGRSSTEEVSSDSNIKENVKSSTIAAGNSVNEQSPEEESSDSKIKGNIEGSVITGGNNVNISTAGRDVYVYNGVVPDLAKDVLDLLNWLSPIDSKAIQMAILEKLTPGTGKWFLESPVFGTWLDSPKKLLWGAGKPGAGKTSLSSIIVNHLEGLTRKDASITVIYVHCRYDDRLTTAQVFATLLRQLAENSETILKNVKENLYVPLTRHGRSRNPTLNQLLDAVLQGLRSFTKTYIVLDAVDELDNQVRHDVVQNLETRFQTPILLTSRLTDLPRGRRPDFEIRAPSADFHSYVRYEISGCAQLQTALSHRQDYENIVTEVASKVEHSSDGLFLVAALQVATLKKAVTVLSLRKAANQLPEGSIDEMYRTLLRRVQDQEDPMKVLAYRVIGWVVYSIRPLKLQEIIEALAVEPGCAHVDWENELVHPETLIATCCGLLTFERATGTIRFIHVTAHPFFKTKDELLTEVFKPSPYTFMAEVCASYMKLVLGDRRLPQVILRSKFSSRAFLDHACRYVGSYIRLATEGSSNDIPEQDPETQVLQWIPEPLCQLSSVPLLTDVEKATIDQGSLAHLAALNGLAFLLRWKLLPSGHNNQALNEESEEGMSPLFYAAIGGRIHCMKLLLQHKDINVHHKASNGFTALITARMYGQKEAEDVLLVDHKAREASKS